MFSTFLFLLQRFGQRTIEKRSTNYIFVLDENLCRDMSALFVLYVHNDIPSVKIIKILPLV